VLGKVDVEYIGVKQVFYSWGTQFMPEITQFLVDELKKRIRGKRRTWRSHNFHFVSYDLLPCALSKGGQRSFVIKHGIVVRRNRMEAGPAHVRRNFDILTCTSRIEDYYDEILSKKSGKEHRIRAERPLRAVEDDLAAVAGAVKSVDRRENGADVELPAALEEVGTSLNSSPAWRRSIFTA
jgi:hypothetical protein